MFSERNLERLWKYGHAILALYAVGMLGWLVYTHFMAS